MDLDTKVLVLGLGSHTTIMRYKMQHVTFLLARRKSIELKVFQARRGWVENPKPAASRTGRERADVASRRAA